MRILRAADHRRMPWKNGGGTTTEIAAYPEGADLDAFGWRISMARVAADGPFSLFPGIDRTLVVLGGEGIELAIEGRGRFRLDTASAPLSFPADAPTTGRLLAGPITDLNVMTRRGAYRHRVERRRIEGVCNVDFDAGWTFLLPRGAIDVTSAAGETVRMERNDALIAEAGEPSVGLTAVAPFELFVVRIEPEPAGAGSEEIGLR